MWALAERAVPGRQELSGGRTIRRGSGTSHGVGTGLCADGVGRDLWVWKGRRAGQRPRPLSKSRTGTGDSVGEEEEKARFPIRQAQGRLFGRFRAGSLTDCGPACQERLGGLGVGCPKRPVRNRPVRTSRTGTGDWEGEEKSRSLGGPRDDKRGTPGWRKRTWGDGGWLLHPGVWFDTGLRKLRPGSPRTVSRVTSTGRRAGRRRRPYARTRRWAELFTRPESEDLLEGLADEALTEHRAGRTRQPTGQSGAVRLGSVRLRSP